MANNYNQSQLNSTLQRKDYSPGVLIRSECDSNCDRCSKKNSCPFSKPEVETFSSLKDKLDRQKLSNITNYSRANDVNNSGRSFNSSTNYGFNNPYKNNLRDGYSSSVQSSYSSMNYNNQMSYNSSPKGNYSGNTFNTSGLSYSGKGSYSKMGGNCSSCKSYSNSRNSSKGKY